MQITRDVVEKVLKIVDAGLVRGLGEAEPGKMCVEAAVCFALGLRHGDNPPCVGKSVRQFKINLNDCPWPTDKDRTNGMRKLAVAQLGSDEIDQQKFLELVGFKCITKILPSVLKNALGEDSGKKFAPKDMEIESIIAELKSAQDFPSAKIAAEKARDIYYAYAYAYAYASASASASAYAYASASASAYAYAYAYAYASASAYAYASASKNTIFSLKVLNMTAQAGLEALIELKSPGCKYLELCDI